MSFGRHLASLAGSWEALVAPHPDGRVVRGHGFVAARCDRHPVYNDAALLGPHALTAALEVFDGTDHVCALTADPPPAGAGARAGFVPVGHWQERAPARPGPAPGGDAPE